MDQLQRECREKGLQPNGNRAVLLGKLKADRYQHWICPLFRYTSFPYSTFPRDEKARMKANSRPHGLNVDGRFPPFPPLLSPPPPGPPPPPPGAKLRLGPDPDTPIPPSPGGRYLHPSTPQHFNPSTPP